VTDSNYTHIVLVADRSGSMAMIQEDAQGSINTFIADQKAQPGRATFTLIDFDGEYRVLQENVDIQDVKPYHLSPRGGTALLDAWGRAVSSTGEFLNSLPEDERPGKVIVVIVTDGGENSSREYTAEQIKELTEKQRNVYSWEFIFLAANQDAVQVGTSYGVATGSALTYAHTGAGATRSFAAASSLVSSYRTNPGDTFSFSDEDRQESKEA
jgi:uncharacterized protein YegL